jgi:hypothetical protein
MIFKEQMTVKIYEEIVITNDEKWVYSYDIETSNSPHAGSDLLHLTPQKHYRHAHE